MALNISMVKFKTAFLSIMVCLGIFLPILGGVIWWAVGERIDSVLKPRWDTTAPPPSPPAAGIPVNPRSERRP